MNYKAKTEALHLVFDSVQTYLRIYKKMNSTDIVFFSNKIRIFVGGLILYV